MTLSIIVSKNEGGGMGGEYMTYFGGQTTPFILGPCLYSLTLGQSQALFRTDSLKIIYPIQQFQRWQRGRKPCPVQQHDPV